MAIFQFFLRFEKRERERERERDNETRSIVKERETSEEEHKLSNKQRGGGVGV